jgi:hypothetical protein
MGTGSLWHITAIDVLFASKRGDGISVWNRKAGVGSRYAEYGREVRERPL